MNLTRVLETEGENPIRDLANIHLEAVIIGRLFSTKELERILIAAHTLVLKMRDKVFFLKKGASSRVI